MQVDIYTIVGCPHCIAAKKFLKEKGIEYNEYDVNEDDDRWHEAMDLADGKDIVPVINIKHGDHSHSMYGRWEDVKPKLEEALNH